MTTGREWHLARRERRTIVRHGLDVLRGGRHLGKMVVELGS
jgi:hypothetical protein